MSLAATLAALRDDRADPLDLGRSAAAALGLDSPGEAAAASAARLREGSSRALEGLPVAVVDPGGGHLAHEHGAVALGPVTPAAAVAALGRGALLLAMGGGAALAEAAVAGSRAALLWSGPALAAAAHDLPAVLGALGLPANPPAPATAARLTGVGDADGPARRSLDLAQSLAKGLGLVIERHGLPAPGVDGLRAVAPAADLMLLPLDMLAEVGAAGLAAVALPGAWGDGRPAGLLVAGREPAMLAAFAARLHATMGGG